MSKIALTLLFLLAASIEAAAQQPALFGRLTVNQTHIVFAYAGDLWAVERAGGRDLGEQAGRLARVFHAAAVSGRLDFP